jgi:hypothetical protein
MTATHADKRGCPEVIFPSGRTIGLSTNPGARRSVRIERGVLVDQRGSDKVQATQNSLQVVTFVAIGMNRLQHVLRKPRR